MKTLTEVSNLTLAAIAAGMAVAAKKIYDYKNRDRKVKEKFGIKDEMSKIGDDDMKINQQNILNTVQDELLDRQIKR